MHHNIRPESPSCPQCRQAGLEVMDPLTAVFCPDAASSIPYMTGSRFFSGKQPFLPETVLEASAKGHRISRP